MKKWLVVLAILVIVVLGYGLSSHAPSYFDDASPVMYFYSDSCHWCLQEKPLLEKLAFEGFRVKPMDVGRNPQYWTQYSIGGTPTFLVNDSAATRHEGYMEEPALRAFLESHGAKIK